MDLALSRGHLVEIDDLLYTTNKKITISSVKEEGMSAKGSTDADGFEQWQGSLEAENKWAVFAFADVSRPKLQIEMKKTSKRGGEGSCS